MGLPARKTNRRYTYGDYRTWRDDERWELIDGVAWNMSPAPGRLHQGVLAQLARQVLNYLEGKPCKAYFAPFDVLLPEFAGQAEDDVPTVVQPDLVVFCDPDKLTVKGATGAPDWVVEILSPYSSRRDLTVKFDLYQRHGVREYWIIDPGNRYVHVHLLGADGRYPAEPQLYLAGAIVPCAVLAGLSIASVDLFSEGSKR